MPIPSRPGRAAAAAVALLAAACARVPGSPTLESTLPARPGQDWGEARAALSRLDPRTADAVGVGGRAATARADVTVAGLRFQEVMITGVADREAVRSIRFAAPGLADPAACERARKELLDALGSDWTASAPQLGAVTATREGGKGGARVVCTGAELSLSIIG